MTLTHEGAIACVDFDRLEANETRTNVAIAEHEVDSTMELKAVMAANGGQVMRIVPKR